MADGLHPGQRAAARSVPLAWIVGDRILAEERWRSMVGKDDLVRMDGKKLDIPGLAGEIDTLPMFASRKWILVQDFRIPEKRSASQDGTPAGEADGDRRLYEALKRTGDSCSVILVSDQGDKRTRIAKLCQERGEYVELTSFKDYETGKMAEWVTARLQARGKQVLADQALEIV